ncbi:MAG: glycoside hydrolase family 65 protein [Aggregatilineales bacterium]
MARHANAKPIYPYSEWEVVEDGYKPEYNYRNETIFALGNGYLGTRGTFEEGYSGLPGTSVDATYLNGFYESEIIRYPEIAYGFAEKSQTMLNVTNGKIIRLFLEDEPLNLLTGTILEYRRILNLREGFLQRKLTWRSPQGREISLDIRRLVSLSNKHLAAIHYELTPLNFNGAIRLESALDGDVSNVTTSNDPRLGSGLQGRVLNIEEKITDGSFAALRQRTTHTRFALVCTMDHQLETEASVHMESASTEFTVQMVYRIDVKTGQSIRLNKYLAYVTSQDYEEANLLTKARATVIEAKAGGFEHLRTEQAKFLSEFWADADIEIKGDVALQQGIRFNMFHLIQAVGRDGKTNICAKGLTGEGYEGHYFWDTEMYVVPFFVYNEPMISRKLLEYRYSILDKARQRARQMAHPRGALFAWRTIDGEECSAYFPAGTAQYHIDADIAFAIRTYVNATGDTEFLLHYGAEMLFETARLWADLGAFIPDKDNQFCINGVTGPDEYTAIVDNNCYTNLMARANLLYACGTAYWMQLNAPDDYKRLIAKIGLEESEVALWKLAGDHMYIPYDEVRRLYKQDDSFLDKEPWDFRNTPPENYPLLIHYHPLVIYRHQVCKQADFVLALFLLGNLFTIEEKRRNYDFYEKVTTHDSSLSTCIFSIVASEIGYHDKAYAYFMNTARMDLDDYHGNVKDGVHIANMAGTWMCLVNGFAGMRAYDGLLSFNPYLPESWDGYSFNVTYQGRLVKVTVSKTAVDYELLKGEPLSITHRTEQVKLTTTVRFQHVD